MDPLSDVLRTFRLSGGVVLYSRFTAAIRTISGALDNGARSAMERDSDSRIMARTNSSALAARTCAAAGVRLSSRLAETALMPALKSATVWASEPAVSLALRMNQANCESAISCTRR
jgi:hypothetical protein